MTYDQPFYVAGPREGENVPRSVKGKSLSPAELKWRFPYARNGYLPPLEPRTGPKDTPAGVDIGGRQNSANVDELHRLQVYVIDLQNRLNKHIDASKRRAKQDRL